LRAAGFAGAAAAAAGVAMTLARAVVLRRAVLRAAVFFGRAVALLAVAVPARLRGLDVAFLAFAVAMNNLPDSMSRYEYGGAYIHRQKQITYGT
jgi:hypothetical protein